MIIKLEGIHPYDGAYPLDMTRLTNRDIHTIKRVTGLMPLDYDEAATKGDTDFIVALTIIALNRSGVTPNEDLIWDSELGKITVDVTDEEENADPPALEPEAPGSPSGSSGPTGGDSQPARILRPTGTEFSEP